MCSTCKRLFWSKKTQSNKNNLDLSFVGIQIILRPGSKNKFPSYSIFTFEFTDFLSGWQKVQRSDRPRRWHSASSFSRWQGRWWSSRSWGSASAQSSLRTRRGPQRSSGAPAGFWSKAKFLSNFIIFKEILCFGHKNEVIQSKKGKIDPCIHINITVP